MAPRLRVWPYVLAAILVPPVTLLLSTLLAVASQSNGVGIAAFVLTAAGVVAGVASLVLAIRNAMANRRLDRAELLEAIAEAKGN